MKLEINHHAYELLLTEEQCFAFFKLQTVQDLLVYLQSTCNIAEEIKTLSIDGQEIDVSDEGLQLPLKQMQSLLPLLSMRELQRLPVELVSQVLSYTDAKTVHALLTLSSRIKPSAMNNHFGSELGKQILTAHFQVDESLWKAFEQFTQKEQAAEKVSTFATWFKNGDLKSFLALINIKNLTRPHVNEGFFLSWVANFGPSVMMAYKDTADATMEQKILYALVAPTNLIDSKIMTEILTAESCAVANYSSLLESLRLTQKIMLVKKRIATEMSQVKATLKSRQFSYINFASVNFESVNLRDANLRGVNLTDVKLSEAVLQGANLRAANLSEADLREANLNDANLSGTNLRGAYLYHADLCGVNLCAADLREAELSDADLRKANLSGANLSGTYLSGADFSSADLSGADLRGITWDDHLENFPNFQHANLAGVQMDFSVFNRLPILKNELTTLLKGIQAKTLTFLKQQIAQVKTLAEVDEIMQDNRNGILYLAQNNQSDVTPAIGTFFPSHAGKLPNRANQFEKAIATRKTELEIITHASQSALPLVQAEEHDDRNKAIALESAEISSNSKKRNAVDVLPEMTQSNKKAKAAEVSSESSDSDVDDASLSPSSSSSSLQPF